MEQLKSALLILAAVIITANLWVLAKPAGWNFLTQTNISLGQILALEGMVLTSIALVLSTRFPLVENFLGGLDQSLIIHRLVGTVGFLFLLEHPLFLALNSLPSFSSARHFFLPGSDISYNLGIFSLYLMLFSFVFLLFIKLPYHLWFSSHQLLALAFLIGSLHAVLIPSDTSRFLPLRLWLLFFMITGTVAGIYSLFLRQKFGPHARYVVDHVERILDTLHVYLRPLSNPLSFFSGQFCYVKFDNAAIGPELHPFSISSSPAENCLRLSIKVLGDYTLKLPNLRQSDSATVFGPHGRFGKSNLKIKNELWVAGGIGATPFQSMLKNLLTKTDPVSKITYFYCVRSEQEAIFLPEINALPLEKLSVQFIPFFTEQNGHLTPQKIAHYCQGLDFDRVLLCGPQKMMRELSSQLTSEGVNQNIINFEEFNFF